METGSVPTAIPSFSTRSCPLIHTTITDLAQLRLPNIALYPLIGCRLIGAPGGRPRITFPQMTAYFLPSSLPSLDHSPAIARPRGLGLHCSALLLTLFPLMWADPSPVAGILLPQREVFRMIICLPSALLSGFWAHVPCWPD